jgi:hypothetical protein
VQDATTEALVRLIAAHDVGFIQYREELAGFFGNMNRYAGGSGGDQQFWIEAWQGGSYHVHRVKPARRGSRPGQKTKDFVVNPMLLAATPAAVEPAA